MTKKIHNYSAGPCILPQEVMKKAAESCVEYKSTGLSILEMSHRSKDYVEVMENARQMALDALNVPAGYTALYLGGGASLGFLITCMNLMKKDGKGAYVNTGTWSTKAIKEAKKIGQADVIASSEDKNHSYIPKGFTVPGDADYLHITTNNTIFGTQYHELPESSVPLVADMSSDIFSKEIDASKFDIIYAGAQKNLGPAGATLYIVRDEILGKTGRDIPSMLDLQVHAGKDSMFNTPPAFPVYVAMLNLQWLKDFGGVKAIQERNEAKSSLLYGEIDRNPLFKGVADVTDRSHMNATFTMTEESLSDKWNTLWNEAGISGIKGHRSVGGYRASMYNALPLESVQVLVDCMKELERGA
ncbi:MAG: 3-phosphoserine/phosphohydroxythreonine transaminase [Flavobacteriales bacterium]|nr:3-phosphoserine/phosphohydroxythreonine transaminase [Flavobacteriales bacterium]NNK80170.1 3-phosphoserine/phosphohydroxythreonine transaminase [Flavobacteriales bacterium]